MVCAIQSRASRKSTYFQIYQIFKDPTAEDAGRQGKTTVEEAEKSMGPYLGHDPEVKRRRHVKGLGTALLLGRDLR